MRAHRADAHRAQQDRVLSHWPSYSGIVPQCPVLAASRVLRQVVAPAPLAGPAGTALGGPLRSVPLTRQAAIPARNGDQSSTHSAASLDSESFSTIPGPSQKRFLRTQAANHTQLRYYLGILLDTSPADWVSSPESARIGTGWTAISQVGFARRNEFPSRPFPDGRHLDATSTVRTGQRQLVTVGRVSRPL